MNDTGTKGYYQGGGINSYLSPLLADGVLIHSVNMVSNYVGSKEKRTGYTPFLGTADGSQVQSLHAFPNINNDPTKTNLIRASGSALYYSTQGTGAWTTMTNGTINAGSHFGAAILLNTMVGGDGVGSSRYTTDGTSWTQAAGAPVAEHWAQYQGRIYGAGTSTYLTASSSDEPTNWGQTSPDDGFTMLIPDEGRLGKPFVVSNRLIIPKSTGEMYKWDTYNLIDMSTKYGPSSPYSIGKIEDYAFFVNQYGNYGFSGALPQLISNGIQRQFYNGANTGIAGTQFTKAPGVCHIYDYYVSVGTITDDFTSRTIPNCIIKYDYKKNEYLNYSFATQPTAWYSYTDTTGIKQLIWGDATGQCYKMDNTVTTDNGNPINSELVYVFHYGVPELKKKWNWWRGFFNPGCEAKVQVACSNVYSYQNLKWTDLGETTNGFVEYRFQQSENTTPVSRFLFVRIYDASNSKCVFLGQNVAAEVQLV